VGLPKGKSTPRVLQSLRELFRRRAGSRKGKAGRWQPQHPFRTRLYREQLEARELLDGQPAGLPFTGVDPTGNVAFVRRLYHEVLDRDADGAGLIHWVNMLNAGSSRADVVAGVWHSTEHAELLVDQFYAAYLHRAADAGGRAFWVSALLGGMSEADVAQAFLASDEFYARAVP
jgi:hypothetical protein